MIGLLVVAGGCSTFKSESSGAASNFHIVQTHFLGSLWNQAHARAAIIAQDGGESFAVPGGAVWAFGDTFKGARDADGKAHFAGGSVSCAIAFLGQDAQAYPPAFEYRTGFDGAVTSPFSYLPAETPPGRYRIWPLGGVYLHGRFYLYYSLIEVFGTGAWDFRGLGAGLSRATNALGSYERLQYHGNWRFPIEPSQIVEAGGWLYLFGIHEFGAGRGVALARVRPQDIENPDKYEFYCGAGVAFSRKPADVAELVGDISGQVSVAWNPYLNKFVMASSSDFFHPREIRFLLADAPYGPWKPAAHIEVPERRQGKPVELVYCAYLHPELFRDNGRIMNLTFSLQLKDAGFDANCEMVEVELK